MPLALYDVSTPARGPVLTDPYLPAVSAGGLDYVYQAPTKATIPSSGKQVRIPLASQTFQATAFHEATPALATTAFLRARVRNDGKRPLLRGPATIFGDGELVGVGEIQTTGPGGDIEFPLGADQDVKLVRQVVPSTQDHRRDHEVGGDDLRRPDPGRQLQEAEGHRRDRRPGPAQPPRQGGGEAARRPARRRPARPTPTA